MTRAVFLDRDGVINEVLSARVKFINTPEQFYLLRGVGEAIKQLNDLGWKVFVVTNQGGIDLGYMTRTELEAIHQKMSQDRSEERRVGKECRSKWRPRRQDLKAYSLK